MIEIIRIQHGKIEYIRGNKGSSLKTPGWYPKKPRIGIVSPEATAKENFDKKLLIE